MITDILIVFAGGDPDKILKHKKWSEFLPTRTSPRASFFYIASL